MKLENLITKMAGIPVIDTEFLLIGSDKVDSIKVQISRWEKTGKIIQLKRGIYVLAESYRKTKVYEPYLAWVLKNPSYISLEKALEYYNLIPEAVPVYTSLTTKRPGKFVSEIGIFKYNHIKNSYFWGYKALTFNKQTGFIASPEKALLDLIYLKHIKVTFACLEELRLQNVEKINIDTLFEYAGRFQKPKILRSSEIIKEYILSYRKRQKTL